MGDLTGNGTFLNRSALNEGIGFGRDGLFGPLVVRGGRAGNLVSPHAGARSGFFPLSSDVARVPAVLAVPEVDVVENEVVDLRDSVDGLLSTCIENDRGGKVGAGWLDLRVGSGGLEPLTPLAPAVFGLVLMMVGGGRRPFSRSGAGLFPIDLLSTTEPVTLCGGLLTDLALGAGGREGDALGVTAFGTSPICA
jgi:hypothetical protein